MLVTPIIGKAAQNWSFNLLPNITHGYYSGSSQRDRLSDFGLVFSAENSEVGGLTLGFSNTRVNAKPNANNFDDITQYNYLISGRKYFNLGTSDGNIRVRLDGYRINNDDTISNTDNVSVIATQVSWVSNDKMLYADLGYANSNYKGNSALHQFTPTLGLGLNAGYDWLQIRSYIISGLDSTMAEGRSSTVALDANWTHYFMPQKTWFMPAIFTVGVSIGEKIKTVDMTNLFVANLADLNRGGLNMLLTWDIDPKTKVSFLLGHSFFRDLALDDNYKLNVVHINLSVNW